jgi:hypothetical protein
MSQLELLKKVTRVLEDAGIEYMVTGSLVSSMQGEPRSTHDIDLIVALTKANMDDLIEAFRLPEYYLEKEQVFEAIERGSMFNLIDTHSGDKVDFWMLTDDPFDQSRFQRRYTENLLGMTIPVSTPEDTILVKLAWSQRSGGSEKQYRDALRVFEVQCERLDMEYLHRWGKQLGVESLLTRIEHEAERIEE